MVSFIVPYVRGGLAVYAICSGPMGIVAGGTYTGTEGAYTIGGGADSDGAGVQTCHDVGIVGA